MANEMPEPLSKSDLESLELDFADFRREGRITAQKSEYNEILIDRLERAILELQNPKGDR